MINEEITIILDQITQDESFIYGVMSSSQKGNPVQKAIIRIIQLKDKINYQLTEEKGSQAFHRNLSPQEFLVYIQENIYHFKQTILFTKSFDYQILVGKKLNVTVLKKPSTKTLQAVSHNRKKEYLLEENTPIPFLVALGVMNKEGKVIAQKRDKFIQINRFLEMVEDVLSTFNNRQSIHLVDFGCGKSYLTFALYHYLKNVKGMNLSMVGVDLKESVIKACQQLANQLGYSNLRFVIGDIQNFEVMNRVDMVVSLHACDTATDAALEKAMRWEAEVILSVPCCQHELYNQIQCDALKPLLKHGILRERFAALATDAARAQLLEAVGYRVQVLEFVDVEHTPKNLLIRAIKQKKEENLEETWQDYLTFKKVLKINPDLEVRIRKKE